MRRKRNIPEELPARWIVTMEEREPFLRNHSIIFSDEGKINILNDFREDELSSRRVLLPMLVNAHTHLELSWAKGKIPAGMDFLSWLKELIRLKEKIPVKTQASLLQKRLEHAWDRGTALLIDICNDISLWRETVLPDPRMKILLYKELLGFNPENAEKIYAGGKNEVEKSRKTRDDLTIAMTPHSPYSCSLQLLKLIKEKQNFPVSVHLAEHKAEMELFADQSGQMADFLENIGAWDGTWRPSAASPVEYMIKEKVLKSGDLAVHLVNAAEKDIALLKENSIIPVLCPRSNEYYQNGQPPVEEMLEAGLNPLLGTDSLASNQSLNPVDEIKAALKLWQNTAFIDILKMATVNIRNFLPLKKAAEQFFPLKTGMNQPILEIIFANPVEDLSNSFKNDKILNQRIYA